MKWTEERVETLKRLWAEGMSARQIGVKLGWFSKNSVIGKAHRLKLVARKVATRHKSSVSAAVPKRRGSTNNHGGLAFKLAAGKLGKAPKAKPLRPMPPPPADAPIAMNLTVMEISDRTCKWPVSGEGAATLFCGVPVPIGGPTRYCPFHAALSLGEGTLGERRASRLSEAAA